jgi:hypothetical protein
MSALARVIMGCCGIGAAAGLGGGVIGCCGVQADAGEAVDVVGEDDVDDGGEVSKRGGDAVDAVVDVEVELASKRGGDAVDAVVDVEVERDGVDPGVVATVGEGVVLGDAGNAGPGRCWRARGER